MILIGDQSRIVILGLSLGHFPPVYGSAKVFVCLGQIAAVRLMLRDGSLEYRAACFKELDCLIEGF